MIFWIKKVYNVGGLMFSVRIVLSVLVCVFFLMSCGGGSGNSESFIDENSELASTVIENYVDDVVIATYRDLKDKAAGLVTAVESIGEGTRSNVQTAADAWTASRIPWEQSEAWLFGPVDSKGHDPALDSWPVNRTDLDAVLASSDDLTEQYISELDPEKKGFHTVEYLIFREGNARSVDDFTSREIEYLAGTAKDIESTAVELYEDWTEGDNPYGDLMRDAGEGGNTVYPSKFSAVEQIIKGMTIILDEVGTGKIADPFDEQDVELVESQFSFNSRADFAHNVLGVLNAYRGCRAVSLSDRTCTGTNKGLKDLIAVGDSSLAKRVEDETNAAIDAILSIKQPFRDSITDQGQADQIKEAQKAIDKVSKTLSGPVLTLLRM